MIAASELRRWQRFLLWCGLGLCLISCGGRTPLASAGGTAGSTGDSTNPSWTLPTDDGSCPPGTSLCGLGAGARCYSLDHDPMNCGRCYHVCTTGIVCSAGSCQQVACTGPLLVSPAPASSLGAPRGPRNATADMNGDGTPDLIGWSESGAITIALGNGDGSFSQGSSYQAWAASPGWVTDSFVVAGDFNEDGHPDLAVAVPGRNDSVDVWLGNADGTLSPRQPQAGQPLSNLFTGDVDRDGHLDIVLSNGDSNTLVVLLGRGDGTFGKAATVSNISVVELAMHDWNGDGIPDLLAMGATLNLLLGTGGGKLAKPQDCGIAVDLRRTVIDDFNGDGNADLATLLYPNYSVNVVLGSGGCAFTARDDYPTPWLPTTLVAGDVTGDGILDLVEVDVDVSVPDAAAASHTQVLVGKGDGTFAPSAEWLGNRNVSDVLIADYNGDGRVDVLVTDDQGVHTELNACQ